MANIAVIGGQWGDEGKGKVVDLLSDRFDVVARWQGGPNAGHTVRFDGRTFALRHIPSGILRDGVTAVIGNGAVVDPVSLLQEIAELEEQGIRVAGRLRISHRAQVILPIHRELDRIAEESATPAIGTTRRGIGPAYMTKMARLGVRLVDLGDLKTLRRRMEGLRAGFGAVLGVGGGVSPELLAEEYYAHGHTLAPFVGDTSGWLGARLRDGARVLFEGAQGTMLDVDHGTYPFVTSSNTVVGGLFPGLGVAPRHLHGTVGVFKAYSTRVGAGPFPTEQLGEAGHLIRERGREFGTVTGRPRRCGWFDGVAARYAAALNGIDVAAITLFDVLDAFDEIPLCVAYRWRGEESAEMPAESAVLEEVEPVLERLPGWRQPTSDIRRIEDLPAEARGYLDRLAELVGCEIGIVSVGPDRSQTIVCSDRLWAANTRAGSPARG